MPAPAPARQLTLTTGRLGHHYQSGTQTRRNTALLAKKGDDHGAQIHPETAHDDGLRVGEEVILRTAHGQVTLPLTLNPGLRPDTVFLPFHWPEAANLLTDPQALDPHSHMPAFKATAVTLRPAHAEAFSAARGGLEVVLG